MARPELASTTVLGRSARACGVARHVRPMLVNTVGGSPEYLYDGKQIARARLEDHFSGKLPGLPMGCDVCYTNHAESDQDPFMVVCGRCYPGTFHVQGVAGILPPC